MHSLIKEVSYGCDAGLPHPTTHRGSTSSLLMARHAIGRDYSQTDEEQLCQNLTYPWWELLKFPFPSGFSVQGRVSHGIP